MPPSSTLCKPCGGPNGLPPEPAVAASASSSRDPGGGEVVVPTGAAGSASGGDPAGKQRARPEDNQWSWGPWTLSFISRSGVPVGYGANCLKHLDPGNANTCTKAITYGTKPPLTDQDCIAKLKYWLLSGFDISPDEKKPRFKHVREMDARAMPVHTDAELDTMLRARGFSP